MEKEELRTELRKRLENTFGERLRGVMLYGSEARDEAEQDSDIDVMVLLEGPIQLWEDIGKGIEATYDLTLKLGRPIHPEPVDVNDFEKGEFSLYRNVKKEGVKL